MDAITWGRSCDADADLRGESYVNTSYAESVTITRLHR